MKIFEALRVLTHRVEEYASIVSVSRNSRKISIGNWNVIRTCGEKKEMIEWNIFYRETNCKESKRNDG